jgi:hypothetical protein
MAGEMAETVLSNEVVSFGFRARRGTEALHARIARFLSPFFLPVQDGRPRDFDLELTPYAQLPLPYRDIANEPIVIRRSTKDLFDLTARKGELKDGRVVAVDDRTCTAFCVNRSARHITAFVSDRSFVHLIEFVRYGALLLEEAAGTVLLHASAAAGADGVVIIMGDKHAGKTTTLLNLVLRGPFSVFSGDKILLRRRGDALWIRGWPDYPHIGMGTLRQHPGLAEKFGIADRSPSGDRKPDSYKELVDLDLYRGVIPFSVTGSAIAAKAIMLPAISAGCTNVRVLDPQERSPALVASCVEHAFEFTPARWHRLFAGVTRDARQIDHEVIALLLGVPWMRVSGNIEDPREVTGCLSRAH